MIENWMVVRLIELLATSGFKKGDNISYEIQDDGDFILVSICVPAAMDDDEVDRKLFMIQDKVNEVIPQRDVDYSWMINAERHGIVVNSVFGGDRSSPCSGYLGT